MLRREATSTWKPSGKIDVEMLKKAHGRTETNFRCSIRRKRASVPKAAQQATKNQRNKKKKDCNKTTGLGTSF